MTRITGHVEVSTVVGERVEAFVPTPLPPADPPLRIDVSVAGRLDEAERALARLELAVEMLPSAEWFASAFLRKEAVLSSQIEGTKATLVDLLTHEAFLDSAGRAAPDDLSDVCNHLDAIDYACAELRRPDGLPLCISLLNECHRRLMRGARGGNKSPGEVRRSQNWIGGTRPGDAHFVPPPAHMLPELLSDLEKYIHAEDAQHPLVRTGFLHVQFETIHPYLDGNGRIGRLLVQLLLQHWGLLSVPLLYLSLYLKQNRSEYYRLLSAVRDRGDWEAWTMFFLEGVASAAREATETARALFSLVSRDRHRVLSSARSSVAAARLFELLPRHPVVTVKKVTQLLAMTKPSAGKAVHVLVDSGVLVETSGRGRDRTFAYAEYLGLLRGGTE